jgi:uncharacterized membrane protein
LAFRTERHVGRFAVPPFHPGLQSRFPWNRFDGWIDAVFAIAATLLVLELRPPNVDEGGLGHALLNQWPLYLIYLLGFVQIAGGWSVLRRVSAWSTGLDHYALLLAFASQIGYILTPFTIAVLGESRHNTADFTSAVRLMAIVMIVAMGGFAAFMYYMVKRGFFRQDLDAGVFRTAYVLSLASVLWPIATLAFTWVIGGWALAFLVLHLVTILFPLDAMSTEQYDEADKS